MERKGERRIEPKRPDNAWFFCIPRWKTHPSVPPTGNSLSLLGIFPPPGFLRRRLWLRLGEEGRMAGVVLTPGLKGWRFLDVVWGQLGGWGCTWELSMLCGLCSTALHSNGTVHSSVREMRNNIARNPVFFTLRTRRIDFCKMGSFSLGLSPGVLHPRNNFFSFTIIYCYSLRL